MLVKGATDVRETQIYKELVTALQLYIYIYIQICYTNAAT